MTGGVDPAAQARHSRRCTRRAAIAWTLLVVAASLVDPGALLEAVGMSPAAGAGGAGGMSAFTVAHLAAYGVLAWLLVAGMDPNTRGSQAIIVAVAVAAAVGVGVELLQVPIAARTASAGDALVNAVGATAGAALRGTVWHRSR